jgi:hypothetical protein
MYIESQPVGEEILDVSEIHAGFSANRRSRTSSGRRFSTFTF